MSDKIARVPIDALDTSDEHDPLEDTGKVLLKANEALIYLEFRRMLERQAERDIVIDDMRSIIDKLTVGHVMAIEEIQKLKHSHHILLRQQVELHERQNIISAVCDAFAQKLETETQERLKLGPSADDTDKHDLETSAALAADAAGHE